MRGILVSLALLVLVAQAAFADEVIPEEDASLTRELAIAAQENDAQATAEGADVDIESSISSAINSAADLQENTEEFKEVQEAVDALDVCQTSRCAQVRSQCRSFARRRAVCRGRIQSVQSLLNNCPRGTSHCVSLRRRITRLMRRYRFFGGKLRWYLRMAKLLAWGPKHHVVKVPKSVLSGKAVKNTKVKGWTPPKIRSVFDDKKSLAARAFGGSRKGRKGVRGLFPKKGRRLLPLPGQDFLRKARRHRRQYKKLMKAKPHTWWADFVRRAERPIRAGKRSTGGRATVTRAVTKKAKKSKGVRGFWKRYFGGSSRFFDSWRSRRLLRARRAAARRAARLATRKLRERRKYWTKVWKRLAGRRASGRAVWKGKKAGTDRSKGSKKARKGKKGGRRGRRGGRRGRRGGRRGRRGGRRGRRGGRRGRRGGRRGRRGGRRGRRGGRRGRRGSRAWRKKWNRRLSRRARRLRRMRAKVARLRRAARWSRWSSRFRPEEQ